MTSTYNISDCLGNHFQNIDKISISSTQHWTWFLSCEEAIRLRNVGACLCWRSTCCLPLPEKYGKFIAFTVCSKKKKDITNTEQKTQQFLSTETKLLIRPRKYLSIRSNKYMYKHTIFFKKKKTQSSELLQVVFTFHFRSLHH